MKLCQRFLYALLLAAVGSSFANELALAPDPPFRIYSVAEGLNQKSAKNVVQDSKGFLWIATFGGLNRFDGENFESFTTRHGLRQNIITALLIDSNDRLWVGDTEGGLTLIEQGEVVLTLDPPKDRSTTIRSMTELGGHLYLGTEPGSLRRVSLKNPRQGIQYLTDVPGKVDQIVTASDFELLLLSDDRLYRYQPKLALKPNKVDVEVTSLAGGLRTGVYVGNRDGQVGRWNGASVVWLPETYAEPITRITFGATSPEWIHTANHVAPFNRPAAASSTAGSNDALVDADGVLWLAQEAGLVRYLGPDFAHYSLESSGFIPAVYAIQPDHNGGYWFGTDAGLMRVTADGKLQALAERLGLPVAEVRSLRLTSDKKNLWIPHIDGQIYRLDTQSNTAEAVFPDHDVVVVDLELDEQERVWAGTYHGRLLMHDPRDASSKEISLDEGASIYSLSMGPDGWLWFTANHSGIYRLNTRIDSATPELVVSTDEIGDSLFSHIVVASTMTDTASDAQATSTQTATEVWFTTIQGGIFRWSAGGLERVIDSANLSDQSMYAISPLHDGTVVVASNKGAYRYDRKNRALQHYGALNGFVGLEGRAHAMYLESNKTLWIGTASGVSAMDTRAPMTPKRSPKSFITKLSVDERNINADESMPSKIVGGKIVIEYAAISTRAPEGLTYSHRLRGLDKSWSAGTRNRSVGYSFLPPGNYEFEVRAKRAGGKWGAADTWSFVVPTPFWRTRWFIGCSVLAVLLLLRGLVHLRLRSTARANQRLREEVAERTRSIERGRAELEKINRQLSTEIEERRRSDAMRADVEARFHQAYQNSPIGMALVDSEGAVYDANPALKALFWPEASKEDKVPLLEVVASHDQTRFEEFLTDFSAAQLKSPSMQFECLAHNGDARRIDFLPSAVRDDAGALRYIVLLANDVTDSYAMTQQLEYYASFDELTGLLNRRAYAKQLEQAGQSNNNDAFLLMLDLDQFKVVNDTCGHAAGDELLRKAAQTILSNVRESDTVARLGGDEFAVILNGCTQTTALARAEQIRESIQDLEFFWDSDVFRIGASIGVVAIPQSANQLSELQQLADAACYAAKDAGRNRVHIVSQEEGPAHEHRGDMRWVQRLQNAIDTNSLVLFGQKIQALRAKNVAGQEIPARPERIEVLIRMRDRKTNRLIPPGAFLPVAERYGLHDKLDLWVVSKVIDVILSQKPSATGRQQFWVNLSGASVSDSKFSAKLVRMVARSGIPSGSLNFEITETAVIRKIGDAARLVSALRRKGCKFALDDFGSGLSSFGYLKKLKVDCLKIDGEYIRNIVTDSTDQIFVKSIIDIAHAMDMEVVAEFVEDNDILQRLGELGSDYAQGYGVHRPEPLDAMVDLVIPAAQAKG